MPAGEEKVQSVLTVLLLKYLNASPMGVFHSFPTWSKKNVKKKVEMSGEKDKMSRE